MRRYRLVSKKRKKFKIQLLIVSSVILILMALVFLGFVEKKERSFETREGAKKSFLPFLSSCLKNADNFSKVLCSAMKTKNIDYCNLMNSERERIFCRAFILKQPQLCKEIVSSQGRDWCYMDTGMNLKMFDFCSKIEDPLKKNSCLAVKNLDSDLCFKGEDVMVPICIELIAEYTKDISVCDKLGEQAEICYENMKNFELKA